QHGAGGDGRVPAGGAEAWQAAATRGRSDSVRGRALPCAAVPVRPDRAAAGPDRKAVSPLGPTGRLCHLRPPRCQWFCPLARSHVGELPRSSPQTLLDAGCGIALIPHVLAFWGFRVTAIDSCPRAVEIASQRQPTEEELARCVPIWDPCKD